MGKTELFRYNDKRSEDSIQCDKTTLRRFLADFVKKGNFPQVRENAFLSWLEELDQRVKRSEEIGNRIPG